MRSKTETNVKCNSRHNIIKLCAYAEHFQFALSATNVSGQFRYVNYTS